MERNVIFACNFIYPCCIKETQIIIWLLITNAYWLLRNLLLTNQLWANAWSKNECIKIPPAISHSPKIQKNNFSSTRMLFLPYFRNKASLRLTLTSLRGSRNSLCYQIHEPSKPRYFSQLWRSSLSQFCSFPWRHNEIQCFVNHAPSKSRYCSHLWRSSLSRFFLHFLKAQLEPLSYVHPNQPWITLAHVNWFWRNSYAEIELYTKNFLVVDNHSCVIYWLLLPTLRVCCQEGWIGRRTGKRGERMEGWFTIPLVVCLTEEKDKSQSIQIESIENYNRIEG